VRICAWLILGYNRALQSSALSSVAFLHIGKCGGTTICRRLKKNKIKFKHFHHKRLPLSLEKNESALKIVLFVRHPVDRFISAFEMAKNVHSFALNGISVDDLNLSNCPAPTRLKRKFKKSLPYTFSPLYDSLLEYFSDANHLAESLYSKDLHACGMARVFMNIPQEHLFKGIGWYLHNGAMIKSRARELFFVGSLESLDHDFNLLKKQLGAESIQTDSAEEKIVLRKADASKKCLLTREGRANIIKWYEPTDYSALISLENHGLISRETLESYYS